MPTGQQLLGTLKERLAIDGRIANIKAFPKRLRSEGIPKAVHDHVADMTVNNRKLLPKLYG